MDIVFLGIVIFLFLLAVFDLSVGVSNDAVNFLNSAIGSRAATFKVVITVAAVGVFVGASMSNGMMDIARHGIFRPEHFTFYDVICIFMAVMVTDIILLDVFNTLGMPTSTTVSMVFELLGAAFAISLLKMAGDSCDLTLGDLLNTEKAISVILGIFLSVAVAFVFGMVVQWLSRAIFTFNYRSRLKWKIGIFGGVASTAIIYFLLIKGIKDLAFMTPELKAWINGNTPLIIGGCFVFFTVLMQILHMLKVNVFKVVVLMGTFSLAMAFAGNDLVNFIGVPLSGLSAYNDYIANGTGDPGAFMMNSLNGSANTPVYFLLGAGVVMVVSLATSKKARKVVETSVNLTRQDVGDEMFGSSRLSRNLVRWTIGFVSWLKEYIPQGVRQWIGRRFNTSEVIMENGAAFDLVRGSVNLVLAGALIAAGTSLKLPLSTTYVTFMVAMGTSLADRAWGRESAVFRITGVISVIGGWFITAGVAFIAAGIIVTLMHFGGTSVMVIVAIAALVLLIRSNIVAKRKKADSADDVLFQTMLKTDDSTRVWGLLKEYLARQQSEFLNFAKDSYDKVATGFIGDEAKTLNRLEKSLMKEKDVLKSARRKETLCLRKASPDVAIEKSAWFHLSNNCCMAILYNLRRINEMCLEHVNNNFPLLPAKFVENLTPLRERVDAIFDESVELIEHPDVNRTTALRKECDRVKDHISELSRSTYDHLREGDTRSLTVMYVYLNLLNETQELVSNMRKLLRASMKLNLPPRMR